MPNLTINNGGITTNSKSLPNIDLRYGPYDSLDAAYDALSDVLVPGIVIGVFGDGGKITEYQAQRIGDEVEFVSREIRISYNDLDDLPKINNTELTGNKTASDLGLATSTQGGKADTAIQTLSIGTTTTGNAGTQANVTNSGTQTNPILNFTIPRGDSGHNPNLGTYTDLNDAPNNGIEGDYIVLVNTSATPHTSELYKWDDSIQGGVVWYWPLSE